MGRRQRGFSALRLLVLIVVFAYVAFVGFQLVSAKVLEKETLKHFREMVLFYYPFPDDAWEEKLSTITDYWVAKKNLDPENFQCLYEVKENGTVIDLELIYDRQINWLFKKEIKKYDLKASFTLE